MDRNREVFGIPYSAVMSLSARRAWIEIETLSSAWPCPLSLSARRAWIEMREAKAGILLGLVALRKESVDRNYSHAGKLFNCLVALRNESVDRNGDRCRVFFDHSVSLSARRAWIEISGGKYR